MLIIFCVWKKRYLKDLQKAIHYIGVYMTNQLHSCITFLLFKNNTKKITFQCVLHILIVYIYPLDKNKMTPSRL